MVRFLLRNLCKALLYFSVEISPHFYRVCNPLKALSGHFLKVLKMFFLFFLCKLPFYNTIGNSQHIFAYGFPFFFLSRVSVGVIQHKDIHAGNVRKIVKSSQMFFFETKPVLSHYFAHKQPEILLIAEGLYIKAFFHIKTGYCHKFLIVLPLHDNVQIIIPRNKPSMTHSAKQGSPIRKVFNIMQFAHSVNFHQHFQLRCPCLFYGSRN